MRIPSFKIAALATMLFASSSVLAATVWKWVDKDGGIHYSDQPGPGAVRVDLNAQTYDADEAKIPETNRPVKPQPRAAAAAVYERIEISNPVNEETISGTGGLVSVAVRVEPGVQPGHSLRLDLDGQRVSELNSAGSSFQLEDVPRGAHTLSASVVARDGSVVIQSAAITFFMLQPIARPAK